MNQQLYIHDTAQVMIKICIWILGIALLFSANAVELNGRVIHAGSASARIPNIDIDIRSVSRQQSGSATLKSVTTDANGYFRAQVQNPDPGQTLFASCEYQGVRYYSNALTLPDTFLTLVVYDTTHSRESLNILMHHVAIQDLGKTVSIRETRVFENTSQRTVLDVEDTPFGPILYRFAVSEGPIRFSPGDGLADNDVLLKKGWVYDKRVLPPGKSQLTFMYELPWHRENAEIVTDIQPGTRSFGVFLADSHLVALSEYLEDRGPFSIGGHRYRRYSGEQIDTSKPLVFTIQRQDGTRRTPWPAILLTTLVCIVGYVIALRVKTK